MNQTLDSPQRITCVMDIGPAVHQRAGLSRYTERLASNLAHHESDLRLAPFFNAHSGHHPPKTLRSLPIQQFHSGQYRWRTSALASQMLRTPHRAVQRVLRSVQSETADDMQLVYHATEHLLPYVQIPSVLTVHDIIFEQLPQHHTRANRAFLKLAMPLFVRRADAVIAVSRTTKQDLIARYGLPQEQIQVVYEGIDAEFVPADELAKDETRHRYSNDAPYLLMVGSIEPRKNHVAAYRALERLKAQGFPHKLLIAGSRGWMDEPILEAAQVSSAAERITFLDFVPQSDLPALYAAADCQLLPSYYEGFGFTALEAMACGTPVVCSDRGSLPEVVGDAAVQVAPDDTDAFTDAIRRILKHSELAADLREKGLKRAAGFTWKRTASETLAVYQEAIALGGAGR